MPYCRVTPVCGKVAETGIEPVKGQLMRRARGHPYTAIKAVAAGVEPAESTL